MAEAKNTTIFLKNETNIFQQKEEISLKMLPK